MSEQIRMPNPKTNGLVGLTADIVSAYVANNTVASGDLSTLIDSTFDALKSVADKSVRPPQEELNPAVPIKKSVTPDHIVCLEDGKKFKSMKRHLRQSYDLSPEEYREKWGLPHTYPMVAPNYAAVRSELAKKIGLGQRQPTAQ